jgi:hypothetical protein
MTECKQSLVRQPVGGRAQANWKAQMEMKRMCDAQNRQYATLPQNMVRQGGSGGPLDSNFVATVHSQAQRGTHRIEPAWRDPRWSAPQRITTKTLYEPNERDPPNRHNFFLYKSTQVDPLTTGPLSAMPLAVPDVHKLRYMHNCYMTPDDWYL